MMHCDYNSKVVKEKEIIHVRIMRHRTVFYYDFFRGKFKIIVGQWKKKKKNNNENNNNRYNKKKKDQPVKLKIVKSYAPKCNFINIARQKDKKAIVNLLFFSDLK